MFAGFKQFVSRGNAIDLAVGVMIGGAFGTIVNSLVKDVITPILGMFGGQPDFSAIHIGPIQLGSFLNAVIAFLIMAAVLYYFIVVPFNRFSAKAPAPPPGPTAEQKLLTEIRDLLAKK